MLMAVIVPSSCKMLDMKKVGHSSMAYYESYIIKISVISVVYSKEIMEIYV